MSTMLTVQQGNQERVLAVPEGTLFSGILELVGSWEHKDCFTFGSAEAWTLDLDGTEAEWSSIPEQAPVAAVIGDYLAPTLRLLPLAAPALKLPVVTADGNACAALELSAGTADEVKLLLAKLFEGDLQAAAVQIPGRTAGSFLAFKLSTCPDAVHVLEHAVAQVGKMVALLRPPVPESISCLRLKLPPDAVLKVQGERPREGGGAETTGGDGVADLEFQAKLSTQLLNAIKASRSGADADRELVQQLCTTGFTLQFQKLKDGKAVNRGPGWVACSLCEKVMSCDEGHVGTIRHCCDLGHISKWLPLQSTESGSASELSMRCGPKWGKARTQHEVRTKVQHAAKVRKIQAAEMAKQMQANIQQQHMAALRAKDPTVANIVENVIL
jgi:hypothetical protein